MTGIGEWKRSCMCAEANREALNKTLTLMGWVQRREGIWAALSSYGFGIKQVLYR